ncbi:MAG TPA: nucleotidyltransferase family protein, partial [Patescibacteria group bacterium]
MESQKKKDISTNMEASDVVKLYDLLESEGIKVWLDGGWAVDALLGKQTRPHTDLDIVVGEKDLPKLRNLLQDRGYKDVERDDTRDCNFVLGDSKGHEVDIHAIVFDQKGNGIYGPVENGEMFPADSLTGEGEVRGKKVRCISAKYMVKFISPWLFKR